MPRPDDTPSHLTIPPKTKINMRASPERERTPSPCTPPRHTLPTSANRLNVRSRSVVVRGPNLGRTTLLDAVPPGTKSETVVARQRRVLALSEFRVSFAVECSELQDVDLDRAAYDAALKAYPHAVAQATEILRLAGIKGPYSLAIGPDGYTRVLETTEHGYPLREHLTTISAETSCGLHAWTVVWG